MRVGLKDFIDVSVDTLDSEPFCTSTVKSTESMDCQSLNTSLFIDDVDFVIADYKFAHTSGRTFFIPRIANSRERRETGTIGRVWSVPSSRA